MAKLYYQHPNKPYLVKKGMKPPTWKWKRLLFLSVIMNLGLLFWMAWKAYG